MGVITPEVESYFASLSRRVAEAVWMPFERVRTADWEPIPSFCHDNTDYWAARAENPQGCPWLVRSPAWIREVTCSSLIP
jgi:hypothetical protein